jgi:eukaryotic-like serine/threonine-protein kinase
MDKNIWIEIKTIFYKAIELDQTEREKYLNEVCKSIELKNEVLSLIAAHNRSDNFLEEAIIPASNLEDNSRLFIGKHFGKYKIEHLVARGGMGLVYLGVRDEHVKQKAAVKIINPGISSSTVINRFKTERQTLANLNHPNISKLLDGGITEDGIQFLVMEYIEGVPIDEFCDKNNLSINERLKLFLKVADVVQYAHQNLVVHRDLKPNNILITENGEPKLLDFGIAKLLSPELDKFETVTQRGMWNLTPEYASPEQIRGEAITTSSDVYSLGIVLYKILSGQNPYKINSMFPAEINNIITNTEVIKPSEIVFKSKSSADNVDNNAATIKSKIEDTNEKIHKRLKGDLDKIVSMAIRKEVARRYSSVEHFAEDIKRYLSYRPVLAHQDSIIYRTGKFLRRNKTKVIPASIIFILINLGLAGILWQGYIAAKERDIAKIEADKSNRIKSFLLEMISSPDPIKDGSEVKVIDVIEKASSKLKPELGVHPQLESEIRSLLGNTYQNLGQYDSAFSELLKADKIIRKLYGNKSKETAISLKSIGLVYHYKGDFVNAEKYFKDAIELDRSVEQKPSFETALLLDAYGTLLSDMGEYEKSEKITEEALKIAELKGKQNDPKVAEIKNNLATSYNYSNKLDKAEKLYKESLEVFRKHYGDNHIRVSSVINNLAFIYIFKEEHQKAIPLLLESLEIKLKILDKNHPDLILAYSNVGSTYFNTKDYDNAEKYMLESINTGLVIYNEDNVNMSRSYMWYGRVLDAKGNYQKSLYYLLKAYAIRKKIMGEDNKLTLTVKSLCGQTYLHAGNYFEAEKYLLSSYNSLTKVSGSENEATQKTLGALIELYKKLGKKEKVESYSKLITETKD